MEKSKQEEEYPAARLSVLRLLELREGQKAFERNVRLWEFETDIPRIKRGVKLMRAMQGLAALAMEELSFDDIACEDGVRNVLNKLKEFFMPQLEVSLPRAFEAAVYGAPRTSKEGLSEYIGRMERAFNRLSREGVDLPEGTQGYILYRQASLQDHQEQRLLTWCDGKYDKKIIVKSLRKLVKVIKDKGKGHYMTEESVGTKEGEDSNETDDGEYIYLEDGDLDEIYEENDVQMALAS
ncbi:unnamed protein product [Durusdinium trenchii]|uniref:Ankyrin-2 n=2 Tax=Durusdinium trenchii TaxID=1381693 RepID=A0ABP0J9E3_9DINO